MRSLKFASAILLGIALIAAFAPVARADAGSVTITIDRAVMPQSIFHPGRFFQKSETVTVEDYAIRNYLGKPIEDFMIQAASGLEKVPVEAVEAIRFHNWVHRRTDDLPHIEHVVEADMLMTDGSEMHVLMNADFGTIEGRTELGDFFLKDPLTVRHLVFNRIEEPEEAIEVIEQPEVPVVVEPEEPVFLEPEEPVLVEPEEPASLPDSDGDGVLDSDDHCPDTPLGAPVNGTGCWTIKGINFDYNKWKIKRQYYDVLNESGKVLYLNPKMTIEIQGHTDEIASEEYNQMLSEKRAMAAKAYFVYRGIEGDRISTRGFGETRPIASNDTPEERAKNRRIEIEILSR
jgi:outer membrane protein OmpA-like peptidoglycan-associated protein